MITHSVQWMDMSFSSASDDYSNSNALSNASLSRWTTRRSTQSAMCHNTSDIRQISHKGSQDPSSSQCHLTVQESRDDISRKTVVDDYSNDFYSDEEEPCLATYSEWDADLDNEYLRACYRMKTSLVIDSSSPHCVPHVVITPCDNSDDDCAAWDNYTEPQNCDYLSVPESSTSSTPLYPSSHAETHDAAIPISQPPKKVFSRSRFTAMIDRSSSDRFKMFHVVMAIYRRQCKLTVSLASNVASTYRKRYDDEHLFQHLEKPFTWTDPAEPLLSFGNQLSQMIVIDSPCPFRIPHIIITAPPPEDLWASFINSIPNPQDSGFGNYLTVPGYGYVNPSAQDFEMFHYYSNCDQIDITQANFDDCDDEWDEDEDVYGSEFLSTLESYNLFDSVAPDADLDSMDSSDSDSPPPETPDDGDDFPTFFGRALAKMTPVRDDADRDDLSLTRCGPSVHSTWDDEDEDLPPLDDEWYQSVIRRTQGAVETQA
ncbi:hypothetical protein VKT23_001794 [Stygiomarasmius scandens]|uniref:Uncharacterized protein n=1 Tax=Marasmiellus scandens TaxID=2682957 RepID=A0ABR1K1B1_9AGAR